MTGWILSIIFNVAIIAIIIWSAYYTFHKRKERDQVLKTFAQMHGIAFQPTTWLRHFSAKGMMNHYPILVAVRREAGRNGRQYVHVALTTQKNMGAGILITPRKMDGTFGKKVEQFLNPTMVNTEKWGIRGATNPLPTTIINHLDSTTLSIDTRFSLLGNTISFEIYYQPPTLDDLEKGTALLLSLARAVDQDEIKI